MSYKKRTVTLMEQRIYFISTLVVPHKHAQAFKIGLHGSPIRII